MEIVATKSILEQVLNDVEFYNRRSENLGHSKVRFDACPTGFRDLDDSIGGISPGFTVIAGRPCNGSDVLFRQLITNAVLEFNNINNFMYKQKALIFSTSLSAKDFLVRILCAYGLIPLNTLMKVAMDGDEWMKFTSSFTFFFEENDPFLLVDNISPLFVEDLDEFILKTIDQYGHLPIIAFDSLQAIRTRKKFDSRYAETAEVSRTLKELQVRYNTRIIAVCSVNRNVEQRADMRPVLSDLRDSGTIEDDANLVLFTYINAFYSGEWLDNNNVSIMEVLVGKNDWGKQDRIQLMYRREECNLCDYVALSANSDE